MQDDVNANLLFAGMEFGVYFTVDGGPHWTQLPGGIPTAQARDLTIQRRETIWSSPRSAAAHSSSTTTRRFATSRPQALAEEARLYPLRDAYLFDTLGQVAAAWGDPTTPNPPYGAVFTYSIGQAPAGDSKLVLTVSDDSGKQVRRLDLAREPGVHRVAWDLRGEPPAAQGGARGARGAGADVPPEGAAAFGGRGRQSGPPAAPGRYKATIGKLSGDTVTAIGQPQSFLVVNLVK